jgi:hypothetical protein
VSNSRSLHDLHPIVSAKAARLIGACSLEGIELMVLSTRRDEEEQRLRYILGREEHGPDVHASLPFGHVITDNPPGWSFHHYGLAFDAWPLVNSRVITSFSHPDWDLCWRVIRRLARDRSVNLRQGSDAKLSTGRREWGHFHYSAGLSIEAVRAGERIPDVEI